MSLRIVEGETLECSELFADEFGDPYIPAEGKSGPEVKLLDVRGNKPELVVSKYATPDGNVAGNWQVDIGVPVLDLQDVTDLQVVWILVDDEHNTHKVKHVLQVEPSSQNRITDIVLLIKNAGNKLNFSLPFMYDKLEHEVNIDFYKGNTTLIQDLSIDDSTIELRVGRELTHVKMPAVVDQTNFEPHILVVDVYNLTTSRTDSYSYKVWAITPQVLTAATLVEDAINKARLANVIPELEYTQQDLIQYLYRGLNMFNMLPPRLTAFNGMDMRGIILNCWVTCASYYALSAQLKAEGDMAFDFSGQSVSFNVDRSPAVEAALGRVETQIDQTIKPAKTLMAKAGLISGTGAQGDKYISGAQNFGMLGLSQSPTTKRNLNLRIQRIRTR